MMISDSTIDVPINGSNDKDDIMPKNRAIPSKVAFFDIISTLPLELAIGTSMVSSDIVIIRYYKGISIVKVGWSMYLTRELCKYCVK